MWAESWAEIAARALSWIAIMLMAWKDNTEYVIRNGSLQCAIFIRAHVPTWIKDWSLFNNLLSLKKMFWSASHSPAALALKHPPVRFVRTHWTVSRRSCHPRKWVLSVMMIHSKGPHLINPKLGHVDTKGGVAAVQWMIRSEPRITKRANRSPQVFLLFSRAGFQSSVLTPGRFYTHLVCQSWPEKPVYVLNTSGTPDIAVKHWCGQKQEGTIASVDSQERVQFKNGIVLGLMLLFLCPKPQFCVE